MDYGNITNRECYQMASELRVTTDDFITVPAAAKQLGRPKMTLYRWIETKKLIAVKFGGILFVPVSEIERLKRGSLND